MFVNITLLERKFQNATPTNRSRKFSIFFLKFLPNGLHKTAFRIGYFLRSYFCFVCFCFVFLEKKELKNAFPKRYNGYFLANRDAPSCCTATDCLEFSIAFSSDRWCSGGPVWLPSGHNGWGISGLFRLPYQHPISKYLLHVL